jgi:hypothetical protein
VRDDLAGDVLPAVAVEHGYRSSFYRAKRMSAEEQLALLRQLPLVSL